MKIKVNNIEKTIVGDFFAYDGCHKIYIIENEKEKEQMERIGYDIISIDKLPETWKKSCDLRFIHNAALTKTYAYQFEKVKFL